MVDYTLVLLILCAYIVMMWGGDTSLPPPTYELDQ